MNKIVYDNTTSLCHFMDQFIIQRLERIIYHEENCTPTNHELIEACITLIDHLHSIWGTGK
jgi:hypothetical protein